ncbi:acyl carrier protein [Sorangium sp. So ce118]
MTPQEVFELVVKHTCQVLPELEGRTFYPTDQLKDLGANSLDRADIVMMTMEALGLRFDLVELGHVQNIGGLAEAFHAKLQAP